jgi:hypothetical protein
MKLKLLLQALTKPALNEAERSLSKGHKGTKKSQKEIEF